MTDASRGLLLALFCFTTWGTFPLFFSLLKHLDPTEVLAHRIIWSFAFVAVLLTVTARWKRVIIAIKDLKLLIALFCSSVLIATNWGVYIWAVGAQHTVDASMGYFINPLVSVALGVIFLRESLATYQKLAILIAASGVLYKVLGAGEFPWIALTLAITFGFYGLVRKQAKVDTITGLCLETLLLFPIALLYWVWLSTQGQQPIGVNMDTLLLVTSGVITALPLMAFSFAAQRLSLTVLGFMTYLAPTLQLLCATQILGEPFNDNDWITFATIWIALILFSGGAIWRRRKVPTPQIEGIQANR